MKKSRKQVKLRDSRGALDMAVLLASIFFLIFTSSYAQERSKKKKEKVKEALQATVNLKIDWNIKNVNKGSLNLHAVGFLKLNREMSSMDEDLPAAMVCYKIRNMTAHYTYRETIIQKNPPGGCNPVLAKYEGTGRTKCVTAPGPGNLIMNSMASMFKNTGFLGKFATNMVPDDMLVDQFMFVVPCEQIVIPGKNRSQNNCKYRPSSRKPKITINIIGRIKKNGRMNGRLSWKAKADDSEFPPWLSVKVNTLPKVLNNRPFTPKKSGNGDVTYTLTWKIEKIKPHILIYRFKDGDWHDITDATPKDKDQEILPGEKLKLKAFVVMPGETENPPKGKWVIKGKILKDWEASEAGTHKIKAERDKNEIEFFWWKKPPTGLVKYVVKSKGLTGKTTFKLNMPQVQVQEIPGKEWGVVVPNPDQIIEACELVPDSYSMQIKSTVSTKDGKPFCLEYVQLVKANNWQLRIYKKINGPGTFRWFKNAHNTMLDTCYPYNNEDAPHCSDASGSLSEEMHDTPNAPFPPTAASIYWDMDFQTYLMFRPGKKEDGNAWIPLRRWHWGWKVKAVTPGNPWDYYGNRPKTPACKVGDRIIIDMSSAKLPKDYDYHAKKAGEYPEWKATFIDTTMDPTDSIVKDYRQPPP